MVAWRDIAGNQGAFEQLVDLLAAGGAVGFVGAGASAGLYPLWPQLIAQLADAAVQAGQADEDEKEAWCAMDALQAAQQIRNRLSRGPFAEQIRTIFAPKPAGEQPYTPVHEALARLGFRAFRPIGRGDALDDLPRLDLLPLDEARRRTFLEQWFRHAGRTHWQDDADQALAHLMAGRGLRDLSGIPLYLTLLAVLWEQDVRPPRHLATLYDEIFELLLAGRHKPVPRPMPVQDAVRQTLRHLAYGMTEDDHWAEPLKHLDQRLRAEALAGVRQQLATVEAWRDDLYAYLRDVHERTQILGPHDGDRGDWRFWHRTFREALTAERLYQQHEEAGGTALIEWARQLEEGGESRWAEPLALLAGRLEGADELVLRLAEANPKLALRAAAFSQGLQPETVLATL